MELKKMILDQLDTLKKMGIGRRQVEIDLKYAKNYIAVALARGGNDKLLNALVLYKERLEQQQNVVNEGPAEYITIQKLAELQAEEISNLRTEKLKWLQEKEDMNRKIQRLENQVNILIETNFKNSTSGKRRRSAL